MNRAAVVLFSLIAACAGTAGAPTLSLGVADTSLVELNWIHPLGEAQGGYAIEIRPIPEAFKLVQTVSPANLYVRLSYPPDTPEATDFEFRVRALPDQDGSRASNTVSTHRGVLEPFLTCITPFTTCVPTNGAFHLAITNHSHVADSLELRRTILRPGVPDETTLLPIAVTATTYDDPDISAWAHRAMFVYAARAIKGAERSTAWTVYTERAPP
jgi:hypothetical protein